MGRVEFLLAEINPINEKLGQKCLVVVTRHG